MRHVNNASDRTLFVHKELTKIMASILPDLDKCRVMMQCVTKGREFLPEDCVADAQAILALKDHDACSAAEVEDALNRAAAKKPTSIMQCLRKDKQGAYRTLTDGASAFLKGQQQRSANDMFWKNVMAGAQKMANSLDVESAEALYALLSRAPDWKERKDDLSIVRSDVKRVMLAVCCSVLKTVPNEFTEGDASRPANGKH